MEIGIRILGDLATRLAKLVLIRFGEEGAGELGAVINERTGDAMTMVGVDSGGGGDMIDISGGGEILSAGAESASGCGMDVGDGAGKVVGGV